MNRVSFPGLGIEPFELPEVAFTVFGRDIRFYGIVITVGIILAFLYVLFRAKEEKIKADDVMDLTLFTVPISIIGARLYYVLFDPEGGYETFYDVIALWDGGLAIYGAVLTGAIVVTVFSLVKKLNVLTLVDMVTPAVLMAQGIGRWGNFFNCEAHGGVTDIFIRMGIQKDGIGDLIYYHPTFLYESLWNFLGFAVLNLFYRKRMFRGQICLMYFIWYGFGRFFIEGLRTDSLYIGPIRVSQLVAASCVLLGLVLFVVGYKLKDKYGFLKVKNEEAAEAAEGEN